MEKNEKKDEIRNPGRNPASPQGLIRLYKDLALILPKDPVEEGDRWGQTIRTDLPIGQLGMALKYTVDEVDDDGWVRFSARPDWSLLPGNYDVPAELKIVAQRGDFQVIFNNRAGRLEDVSLSQEVSFTLEALGSPGKGTLSIEAQLTAID